MKVVYRRSVNSPVCDARFQVQAFAVNTNKQYAIDSIYTYVSATNLIESVTYILASSNKNDYVTIRDGKYEYLPTNAHESVFQLGTCRI